MYQENTYIFIYGVSNSRRIYDSVLLHWSISMVPLNRKAISSGIKDSYVPGSTARY